MLGSKLLPGSCAILLWIVLASCLFGQAQPQAPVGLAVRPDYILGSNDQILIRSAQVAEISDRPFRIDTDGFIELPLVGRIKAAGMTIQALETDLASRFREYVRNPQVFITLTQFRSEPVFFMGAFRTPGIYPLQGGRSLIEMLSYVGGLQPNASRRLRITRRSESGPIPLPNAVQDADKKVSTVDISLERLTESVNPEEDIILKPFDVVSAERAERVYVTGDVTRASSIELGERNSISVTQALAEAGGLTPTANRDKVRVLRPILGTNRRAQIEIDLKGVLAGRARDFPLLPNDVLFVPRSGARTTALALGTSMAASVPYIIVTALLR